MLEWRLNAYRYWTGQEKADAEPKWANVKFPPINYQGITYYSAPKQKKTLNSLDEMDPEILRTYEKLGIPLAEQKLLANVAVDAVFDSVSVATTFKAKLAEAGVIFCSFSEAVQKHPELVNLCTCRRACGARWSCRRTSALTRRRRGSLSGR